MMSVMDNGRRRSIKKQIFLSLSLFFAYSNLNAASCPQTVGVVTPGESIWQVTSRIGQATNVIESLLCTLKVTSGDCSFVFGQTDIGIGNIYTISVPGVYCMKETVTFTVGTAITVNSSNVTIDMRGFTLSGGDNSTTGILLGNGIQNVIIKNGIIEHIGGTTPNGIAIRDTVGATQTLQNITIQDMNFNNNSVAGISFDKATVGVSDVEGILVQNCYLVMSGNILIQGISGIVQGCTVVENRDSGVVGGIQAQSAFGPRLAASFIIQDCSSLNTNTVQATNIPIQINNTQNAIIKNCIVNGTSTYGIHTQDCANVSILDCVVQGGSGSLGINAALALNPSILTSWVIEQCVVYGGGVGIEVDNPGFNLTAVKITNCFTQGSAIVGFAIAHPATSGTLSGVTLKGCSATGSASSGFLVFFRSAGTPTISQVVFEDCISQDNGGDGFSLYTPNLGNTITGVAFHNCVARHNLGGPPVLGQIFLGDGFGIGSSPLNSGQINDIVFQSCIAQDNANNGFNLVATVTLCKILDCCAMNNTGTGIANVAGNTNRVLGNAAFNNGGADISGVTDLSLLVSSGLMGGLAGATRWVNAIS